MTLESHNLSDKRPARRVFFLSRVHTAAGFFVELTE